MIESLRSRRAALKWRPRQKFVLTGDGRLVCEAAADGGFDAERVGEWRRAGARLVGGCCRTGPEEIAAIARMLGRTPGAADAIARVAAS